MGAFKSILLFSSAGLLATGFVWVGYIGFQVVQVNRQFKDDLEASGVQLATEEDLENDSFIPEQNTDFIIPIKLFPWDK